MGLYRIIFFSFFIFSTLSLAENKPPKFRQDPVPLKPAYLGKEYKVDLNEFVEDEDGDAVVITGENLPSWLTLTKEGVLTGKPDKKGKFAFVLYAKDESNPRVTGAAEGAVGDANLPPVVHADKFVFSLRKGETRSFDISTADYCKDPESDTLSFKGIGLPGWIGIDQENLFFKTAGIKAGEYKYQIEVSDSFENTVRVPITVRIEGSETGAVYQTIALNQSYGSETASEIVWVLNYSRTNGPWFQALESYLPKFLESLKSVNQIHLVLSGNEYRGETVDTPVRYAADTTSWDAENLASQIEKTRNSLATHNSLIWAIDKFLTSQRQDSEFFSSAKHVEYVLITDTGDYFKYQSARTPKANYEIKDYAEQFARLHAEAHQTANFNAVDLRCPSLDFLPKPAIQTLAEWTLGEYVNQNSKCSKPWKDILPTIASRILLKTRLFSISEVSLEKVPADPNKLRAYVGSENANIQLPGPSNSGPVWRYVAETNKIVFSWENLPTKSWTFTPTEKDFLLIRD